MDNKTLKSSIKAYCRELLETSTSGGAGGYLTKAAFRKPTKKDKNSPTGFESSPKPNMYTKTMKFKIIDPSDRIDAKDLWKGEHLEEIKVNTPGSNIFPIKVNNKEELDRELGRLIKNGFEPPMEYKGDYPTNIFGDKSTFLFFSPNEAEKYRIDLNESRYTQFKKSTSKPKPKDVLHRAIKEIQMKLDEVNRLIEFTTRIKGELQENDQEIEYLKRTKDSLYKIQDKLKEAFSNISKINEIKVNTPISLDSLIKKYSSFPYNMKERDIIFHLQDHEDENVKSQVKNYIKNRVNKLT